MLKVALAVALLCSLTVTSVSYSCGYGFSGLNGRIYVYMSKPHDHLFAREAGPPIHPLRITSAEEAASYFDEFGLATLDRRVDWSKQSILVFAWTGAPDDSIQIMNKIDDDVDRLFLYSPGKHEGQRRHLEVYRVDHDMNWDFHALPDRLEHLVETNAGDLRDV
jgi:hypothetical protein